MKNTAEFLCDDQNTRLSTRTKITGLKTTTPVLWLFAVAAVMEKSVKGNISRLWTGFVRKKNWI